MPVRCETIEDNRSYAEIFSYILIHVILDTKTDFD